MIYKIEDLKRIIDLFSGIINKEHNIEDFRCIGFDGEYTSCHNIETGAITEFKSDFKGMLQFDKFKSFIDGIDSDVEVEFTKNIINFKSGKAKAVFPINKEGELPEMRSLFQLETWKVPNDVKEGLKFVLPFVSLDMLRLSLIGVFINNDRLIATNGHRIGKFILSESVLDGKVIVSADSCRVFSKFNFDRIFIDDKSMVVGNETTRIIGSLVDGTFPDTDKIFPSKDVELFELPKEDIIKGLKHILCFSGEAWDIANVIVSFDEKQIKLNYEKDVFKIDRFFDFDSNIPDTKFKINPNYYLSLLENCDKFSDVYGIGTIYGKSDDGKREIIIALIKMKDN